MDEDALSDLIRSATDLWKIDNHAEAEPLFRQAYPHLDLSYWNTTNVLNLYALSLAQLGRAEESIEIFKKALDSAAKTDSEDSVTVTYARFCLGDHLVKHGRPNEAMAAILPSLKIECESKWLLTYLAAKIHFRASDVAAFERSAAELMQIAPQGRFTSIERIKELIESEGSY